jgi:HlyD family secretion protein
LVVRRLLAALALLLASCSGGNSLDPGPTATVERGRIERIVVATGTIEPEKEVEVRPRIAGIIETIHVEAGDQVEKNQPLVEIERELLEAQVREAEAGLREARVELHYAKIALDRSQELERGGAASQQKRDDARSRHERSQAGVARAEARLQTLSTQLSYASVVSPLAGRVLDVHVEEGSAVSPVTAVTGGTLLLSLAGTSKLHLRGLVDENELARVALGQKARVRTEAYHDRTFTGVVTNIAPLGKRIQNVTYFELEIEIVDDGTSLLRPRMSGDADIVTEVVGDALMIPETALRYRGERIYVETVTRDTRPRLEERDIEIGIVDGTRVQVLSGLEEDDEVRLQ